MKKNLLLASMLFAGTVFAGSPCDGLNIIIVNHTAGDLTVTDIDTYKGSLIEPMIKGTHIAPATTFYSQIYAGDSFWGNAKGDIELGMENYPDNHVTLHYGCVKLFPQVPYIGEPESSAVEPHYVHSHLAGSSTIFEIYGP